ncbi:MAG: thymidylate synthase [Thermoanaerobaculia bacterium]
MPEVVNAFPRTPDAAEAFVDTLERVLDSGLEVTAGKSLSIGSEATFHELLNFGMVVENPRERVIRSAVRGLNVPAAVARFVWMMAGSDRLADIAFYEPKVRAFTDDGVSVPGSNYGQRLLQARPGLNQLTGAIRRLREDPSSRRAALVIYHPEDTVRESKDIPCTFGLFYHIRDGRLHATTLMRSNNAFVLLPYNLFEFSLLAEVVATECGVPLGPLTHIAVSMHVFARDVAAARDVISKRALSIPSIPIPPMPPSALAEVHELVVLESELRHGSAALSARNVEGWIDKGEKLSPYWRQYFYLLLVHVARQNHDASALESIRSVLESPWRELTPKRFLELEQVAPAPMPELDLEMPPGPPRATILPFTNTRLHQSLRDGVGRWEVSTGKILPWRTFVTLEEHYGSTIAAQGAELIDDSDLQARIDRLLDGA